MKKIVSIILALCLCLSVFSFASAETVEEVIAQAETMTLDELFQKAIEESNGKRFDAVGNSRRGKSVLIPPTPWIMRAAGSSPRRTRSSTS